MITIQSSKPELPNALMIERFLSYRGEIIDLSSIQLNYMLDGVSSEYQQNNLSDEFENIFMVAVKNQASHYHFEEGYDYDDDYDKTEFDSDEEHIKNSQSTNYDIRALVAVNGKCLDVLVHDNHWRVRKAVAQHFHSVALFQKDTYENEFLDILVKDSDWRVRKEVAHTGINKYTSILRADSSEDVVAQVIHYSGEDFALTHADSKSVIIRCAVAAILDYKKLESIDMINDESPMVRNVIANRDLFIDHFRKDEDIEVRMAASGLTIPF